MSIIDDMINLVMQNPNVTAKEIAARLGYAEEKSVYYWLQKAGFRGLKQFRASILSRILSPSPRKTSAPVVRDSGESSIPAYPDGNLETEPLNLWDQIHRRAGPSSYGVILARLGYPPMVSPGDMLVVDPDAPCFQGDLIWVSAGGSMCLARQYGEKAGSGIFVDATKPGVLLSPDSVEGKIVMILRSY